MIEIYAHMIIGAPVELRTMKVLINQIQNKAEIIGPDDNRNLVLPRLERFLDLLNDTGARAAIASALRLQTRLSEDPVRITYQEVLTAIDDIESRFSDEIESTKVIILTDQESQLFGPANSILLPVTPDWMLDYSSDWPIAALEFEEAAKCLALGRSTASVFHCMRCLEVGVEALAKFLEMDPPTRTAEKNWTFILSAIKSKLDEKYPSSKRLAGTLGEKIEKIYATLDAVKNPWRNATMHIDATYLQHEALHIVRCVGFFLVETAKQFDQNGQPKQVADQGAS